MDPAHDFLTPHSETTRRLVPAGRARPARRGRLAAVAKAVGLVVLMVAACSPLWGLAVFFGLH